MLASAASIIEAINAAIKIGAALIQVGKDAAPVAALIYDSIVSKKKITQDQLDTFVMDTDKLSDELMASLPED